MMRFSTKNSTVVPEQAPGKLETAPRRIEALTGVRGAAALWVLFHHLAGSFPVGDFLAEAKRGGALVSSIATVAGNAAAKGWLGVDLFFILSGFVISLVHRNDFLTLRWGGYRHFMWLRFSRIYPAHLVTTLALIPMMLIARYSMGYRPDREAFALSKLVAGVLLIHGWGIPHTVGWNVPSWSVSSEWFAYLCFPLLAAILCRRNSPRLSAILAVTVIVGAALLSHMLYGDKKYMFNEGLTLLRVMYEFVIGCLLFNVFAGWKAKRGLDALSVGATTVIVGCSLAGTPNRLDWIFVAAFSALVFGLTDASGFLGRALSSRAMVWLGEISYSVYLVHSLVLSVVVQASRRLVNDVTWKSAAASAVVCVALSVLGGALLYQVIERPMRRRLRDLAAPGNLI